MLQIVYGPKGSGKTKRLIDMANAAIETTTGNVAFLDDDSRYRADIKYQVRFIDASQYEITGVEGLLGFLSGLVASNFDLSMVFVDAFVRLAGKPVEELADVFAQLDSFSQKHALTLVLCVSSAEKQPPEWLKPYVV